MWMERWKLVMATLAMFSISVLSWRRATAGVLSMVGSRYLRRGPCSLSFAPSGTMRQAVFTRMLVKGSATNMVQTLKKVWNMASCICGAFGNHRPKRLPKLHAPPLESRRSRASTRKRVTPITLNIKWMRAVRLAFVPLVIPAMIATTQEPMLEPMVR